VISLPSMRGPYMSTADVAANVASVVLASRVWSKIDVVDRASIRTLGELLGSSSVHAEIRSSLIAAIRGSVCRWGASG